MKFLIIFLFFITTTLSYSNEVRDIKNIVIHKKTIAYKDITFKDINNKDIKLDNFKGKILILNFWATWCAPCREEMPSLDLLNINEKLSNLQVFPINIGQEDPSKSIKFFKDLKIKNLKIYHDPSVDLAKKFKLRGVPTTIIINKKGNEFARILGSIDFNDKKFISWLETFN